MAQLPHELRGWASLTKAFTGKFVYIAHHYILLQLIPLTLVMIERDGGLITLCHSWWFDYQQRELKTFPNHDYLHSNQKVMWMTAKVF